MTPVSQFRELPQRWTSKSNIVLSEWDGAGCARRTCVFAHSQKRRISDNHEIGYDIEFDAFGTLVKLCEEFDSRVREGMLWFWSWVLPLFELLAEWAGGMWSQKKDTPGTGRWAAFWMECFSSP